MISSYSLNDIPNEIPPFQSLAGQDDCIYGFGDVFVNYYDELTGSPIELVDTGNNYIANDYGVGGALILKNSMTDKEYIEYLYSLRHYDFNLNLVYSASKGSQSSNNYRSSSFNINLNYTLYPILDDHAGEPTFSTAEYIAPPARCLLNNRINKGQVGAFESAYIHFDSFSGADEIKKNMTSSDYQSNKTFILSDNWTYGNYLFFRRVNIWEKEYYSDGNYGYWFWDATTDEEREPFNFLGTGLALNFPAFTVSVPYYDSNTSRYYHDNHRCSLCYYYGNPQSNSGRDASWSFTFDGVDYQSYFNVLYGTWSNRTTSCAITTADSYFTFLN